VCDTADVCNGTSPACPALYAMAGTRCRAAAGPCDAAESCTGSSATCPPDAAVADGTPCDVACGAETCVSGVCTGGVTCGLTERCGCDRACVCLLCSCP
jgi:hypothetical protein